MGVVLGVIFAAGGSSAGAAVGPCEALPQPDVARLIGSTSNPQEVVVDSLPGCRFSIGGDLVLDVVVSDRGSDEYRKRHDSFDAANRREIEGYVDEALFGWGVGPAFDLVARRGDTVVALRLVGQDPSTGFDSSDPLRDAPGENPAGTKVGSAMWALATKVFAEVSDAEAPTSEDLSGLWRTNDITPCAPETDIATRISRVTASGGQIRAVKVTGDTCLDDGQPDFEGTSTAAAGSGLAFGIGTGSNTAGVPYELSVLGPERIRLAGQTGTLRYTTDYERLSWPGLDSSSSVLLGIPSPSQALTAKNVALATALSVVLFSLVIFPTTLFNSTLEANLDRYTELVARLRQRLGFPVRSTGPNVVTRPRTFWEKPAGVLVYLVGSGLLYSLMQPGWGLNRATLITVVGFIASLLATSAISVISTRVYYGFRYRDGGGRPAIEGSTLGIAAVSVAASRAVGFLPGYLYGVVVGWTPNHDGDEFDRGRVVAFNAALTAIVAVVAWMLIPVCRNFGGPDPDSLKMLPLGVVAGLFVGSAHTLTIGLIPLEFLPGRTLKKHRRITWIVLWVIGGFLYSLVLLKPGLVTADSGSIFGTLALAAAFSVLALGFWAYHRPKPTPPVIPGPLPAP